MSQYSYIRPQFYHSPWFSGVSHTCLTWLSHTLGNHTLVVHKTSKQINKRITSNSMIHTSDNFIGTPRLVCNLQGLMGRLRGTFHQSIWNDYISTCVEIVILNAMCLWPCWWRMNKLRRLGAFAVSPLWSLDISWCVLYDCVKYFHYTRRVTSKQYY